MLLFHGSDVEVRVVDLSHSLMFKDFGPGFYLSEDASQAENFAKYKADRPKSRTHQAVVSIFEFNEDSLSDGTLRIRRFDGYSPEWIDFITEHRCSNKTDFDLIIGPIANDDVRAQYARFEIGEITKEELLKSLKYKKVTFQYCFKTTFAISMLRYVGNE